MATDLFLRSTGPVLWRSSQRISVKDAGRGVTPGDALYEGSSLVLSLSTSVGTGAGIAGNATSVAGPTAGVFAQLSSTSLLSWFSAPLSADVTISGTVSFAFCGLEAAMQANATFRIALYRVDEQGALTLIINSTLGTELGTALARHSWSGSPTSTDMKIGDRLLVLVLFDDATSVTMASGHVLTCQYDGANASTADSKVTLTENLSFTTADPSGSLYYLRDTASDVSGAKALSTVQGSGTVEATHTTTAGPHTFPGVQWGGGSPYEWFTPTLNAFTLSDTVMVTLTNNSAPLESTTTPFDSLICEIAICDADGSNATVWARSYTSTVATADKPHYCTGPSTAVAQGKRLRLRIFSDDMRPHGNQAAGTDRTIRYDGTSTYASSVTFTQTITEFVPADTSNQIVQTMTQAVHRSYHY